MVVLTQVYRKRSPASYPRVTLPVGYRLYNKGNRVQQVLTRAKTQRNTTMVTGSIVVVINHKILDLPVIN